MTIESISVIRARDVMTKGIVSVDGMATAKDAAAKMRSEQVASLLVNKRHADDAWGILVIQDGYANAAADTEFGYLGFSHIHQECAQQAADKCNYPDFQI